MRGRSHIFYVGRKTWRVLHTHTHTLVVIYNACIVYLYYFITFVSNDDDRRPREDDNTCSV